MKIEGDVDVSSVLAGLRSLGNEKMVSLARSMGVAGGKVLRDEAKARAPVESGGLRDALYLAFKDGKSTEAKVIYSVTWNAKKAPHGHLIEFGHWRYNKIINGRPQKSLRPGLTKGKGPQDHVPPGALDQPVWVSAHPFLRPAYTSSAGRALQAMAARGRERLAEILAGAPDEP